MSSKSGRRRWKKYAPTRIMQALPPTPAKTAPATGEPAPAGAVIQVIAFGPDVFHEQAVDRPEELRKFIGKFPVVWVNVDVLGNPQLVAEIGDMFGLHALVVEDVMHVHQRAKVEQYGEQLFIVARMVEFGEQLETEQISLFLGKGFVLTFQERAGEDSISPLRDRLRRGAGRIRQSDAGYLAYAVLDAVIDGYFPVLDRYSQRLEDLERDVVEGRLRETVSQIHQIKTELLLLRRSLWPHREALNHLLRDPNPLFGEETRIFLRDVYDHTVQLIDLVETYRELCADLRDLHLSSASHRMNEIMKVLTVISTIFIPLTFIAGVYGMNFHDDLSPWNMPELRWYYGYPIVLAGMAILTGGLLVFFRRKGWLGDRPKAPRADDPRERFS